MGDMNGFDPFVHSTRFPGPDFWPGPYESWAFPDYKDSVGFTAYSGENSYPSEPPKGY